jgi:hypothetical protein
MKKIKRIEFLVDRYHNAEEMVEIRNFTKQRSSISLIFILFFLLFMGYILYTGEELMSITSLTPVSLLFLAMYVGSRSRDSKLGKLLKEPSFFQDEEIALFKKRIRESLLFLYPFDLEANSEEEKEVLRKAHDIIKNN